MQVSSLPNRVISETLRIILAKILPEALSSPSAALPPPQSTHQPHPDPKLQLPKAVPLTTTYRHDADLAKSKWPIVEVSPKWILSSELPV